jgi:hypothetical protein
MYENIIVYVVACWALTLISQMIYHEECLQFSLSGIKVIKPIKDSYAKEKSSYIRIY